MAVPVVGLVACTAVSVGAAAGEVVNAAGAETGLVAPLGLMATTCTLGSNASYVLLQLRDALDTRSADLAKRDLFKFCGVPTPVLVCLKLRLPCMCRWWTV